MQQSDYILREIEKISVLIMGLIGKLTEKKKSGIEVNEDAFNEAVTEFENNANFDIETVLRTPPDAFGLLFRRNRGMDARNTELVADLLVAMGEIALRENKMQYFETAMEVYTYLDHSAKTYSIERAAKMKQLHTLMKGVV